MGVSVGALVPLHGTLAYGAIGLQGVDIGYEASSCGMVVFEGTALLLWNLDMRYDQDRALDLSVGSKQNMIVTLLSLVTKGSVAFNQ